MNFAHVIFFLKIYKKDIFLLNTVLANIKKKALDMFQIVLLQVFC